MLPLLNWFSIKRVRASHVCEKWNFVCIHNGRRETTLLYVLCMLSLFIRLLLKWNYRETRFKLLVLQVHTSICIQNNHTLDMCNVSCSTYLVARLTIKKFSSKGVCNKFKLDNVMYFICSAIPVDICWTSRLDVWRNQHY